MAVVTSNNIAEWKANEMARRNGQPAPKKANPYADLSRDELKAHKAQIKEVLKETKVTKAPKE